MKIREFFPKNFFLKIIALLLISLGIFGFIAFILWWNENTHTTWTYPEDYIVYFPAAFYIISIICTLTVGIFTFARTNFFRRHPIGLGLLYIFAFAISSVAIAQCVSYGNDSFIEIMISIESMFLIAAASLDIINILIRKYFKSDNIKAHRIIFVVSMLTVSGILFGLILPRYYDAASSFPDPVLRQIVRHTCGKDFGFVTQSDLERITEIHATGKHITSIEGLEKCTGLEFLSFNYNYISNISPLVQNSGMGAGDHVGVDFNPLSEESIHIYIPELQSRGVYVAWRGIWISDEPTGTPVATPTEEHELP